MAAPVTQQQQQKAAQNKADDTVVDTILSKIPLQQVSFGVLLGAAAGSTFKKWTKDVAYGVGVGFIFLQTLSYYGFIQINWRLIKEKTEKALDADGDGKFDMNDVKVYAKKLFGFLKSGIPDTVGFGTGLYLGLQYL